MQTNTEYITTIINLGEDNYLLKKGSYIILQDTQTSNKLRKKLAGPHRKEGEGRLLWGIDVDPQIGYVKRDIKFTSKTQLANYVFGTNELKLTPTKKNGKNLPEVIINYINFDEDELSKPKSRLTSKLKNKTKYEGMSILDDLKTDDEITTQDKLSLINKGELLIYWVSKKGYGYQIAKYIQNRHNLSNNTLSDAIQHIFIKNYITREGVDESKHIHKYTNWTMSLTNKGEERYIKLVTDYVKPHKQAAYLNIGKLPYQDDLQPEGIYDLYQRFTHNEGVGPLPEHNAQKVLAMVNHYAMGIGKYNFKDDFNKVLAEEFNTSVILVIKQHIKGVLDLCEGEVNRNQTDTQIKEFNQLKVSALTHMLEVIDDTMDVMH